MYALFKGVESYETTDAYTQWSQYHVSILCYITLSSAKTDWLVVTCFSYRNMTAETRNNGKRRGGQ
jgi:hypothetical protein